MHYEGTIIRPPSEANSIILQVTLGCSHNKCSFCSAYKDKLFQIKSDEVIDADIEFASQTTPRIKRVFLADGDALIIPHRRLVSIFKRIREKLPQVNRIALYANAKSIRLKTIDQLIELKQLGLARIYMGLESGHDMVLTNIFKGETSFSMIEAANKVTQVKIFLSVTVLLGIGGTKLSEEHALLTANTLNKMQPNQVAALTLMVLEGSPLAEEFNNGTFLLPDRDQLIKELFILIANLNLNRCQFHSNHASNYLPIEGRLPKDKEYLLQIIDQALAGHHQLVPESLRSL